MWTTSLDPEYEKTTNLPNDTSVTILGEILLHGSHLLFVIFLEHNYERSLNIPHSYQDFHMGTQDTIPFFLLFGSELFTVICS